MMLGLYVTVPIACFRKGLAREYLETELLPPPATCYGFLLSLVGETRRSRHAGCRIAPVLLNEPERSVVLRNIWRCKDDNYWVDPNGRHHIVPKDKKARDAFVKWTREKGWPDPMFEIGLGCGTNMRPDYQQLLSPVELVVWLESSEETAPGDRLEDRVIKALEHPETVDRFGGLALGESTHLVDQVRRFPRPERNPDDIARHGRTFLVHPAGRLTLPVWVDHVGSADTRYATGNLESGDLQLPPVERMPRIAP